MEPLTRLRTAVYAARNDLPTAESRRESDSDHLMAAIDWLAHSQDVTGTGGSAATYNLVLGWEEPYPETTGYIVPTLLTYADMVDAPTYAERAVRMADWLVDLQRRDGSFPGGTGRVGGPSVFNTGQIVLGLANAYRETEKRCYRIAVREACDWLVDVQRPQGYWDQYDYKGEVHAYTTRVAWALLEGAEILPARAEAYRTGAIRNLDWAVDRQRPNGWFDNAGFESGATPYLHTIAYTVRGLLESGVRLERERFVDAATRTAEKLRSLQRRHGILKGAYDESWSPSWYYCLTGNAQVAIIWLRLYERTDDDAYLAAARRSLNFLKHRQMLDGPSAVRGAIPGSYPIFGPYMYLRYPNWAAKFLADALCRLQKTAADPISQRSVPE